MSKAPSTAVKVVFGAMTFGKPNTLGARVHTSEEASKIVDIFQQHGHNEVDAARIYGNGSTEEILAELDWQKRGIVMDTKLYPSAGGPFTGGEQYTHQAQDVRAGLLSSLKALNTKKIDMFYLHGPDRKTPYEDTLREVNKLHQEGFFNRFGLSNYQSWEVAQICEICEKNGWIKPTVYQGVYHALQRTIEAELFPCLRHYGIALYAFQPLAGGFLTGRYQREQTEFEAGSRFDPKIMQGSMHRGRYWNDSYFDAMDDIKAAADKHGLTRPMTYSPSGMSSSGRSDSILSSLESPFPEEEAHRPTSRNSRRTVKVMRSPASRTIALDEEQEDERYFSSAPVHPVSFFSTPPPRPSLDLERWDSTFGTSSPPGDESATCEDEPEATTPTCADALRHEWEALSLRVKFSLFRFRRRLAGHG